MGGVTILLILCLGTFDFFSNCKVLLLVKVVDFIFAQMNNMCIVYVGYYPPDYCRMKMLYRSHVKKQEKLLHL